MISERCAKKGIPAEGLVLPEQFTSRSNAPYGGKFLHSVLRLKPELEFILGHFASNSFPRTISTKTTEGRQVLVDNEFEALARFKQVNYLDCRINAYSRNDIKGAPNFLFLDLDTVDQGLIENILNNRFRSIGAYPTVLSTGSGFHIYQPISSICLDEIEDFSSYREVSKRFLKFADQYLSDEKCDPNHHPSFKSCMVRIPGSINSKNGNQVKIIQKWNGQRPSIIPLLGIFYSWLATKRITQEVILKKYSSVKLERRSKGKIQWIESLLKIPLDDYRKTIVKLVLAPYLVNLRRLHHDNAFEIINNWLDSCAKLRKLEFNLKYLINDVIVSAAKTDYMPMRIDTLKKRNPEIYRILKTNC